MAALATNGHHLGRADIKGDNGAVTVIAQYAEEGVPPAVLTEALDSPISMLDHQRSDAGPRQV
jgi:uncharacterized protein YcaQ